MISGSLWNYYRDQIGGFDNNASEGKWFKDKTKIIGKIAARPPLPGNPGNTDQPEQPPVPSLFHSNILENFNICQYSWWPIYNPVKHLWWNFYYKNSDSTGTSNGTGRRNQRF